MDLSREIDRMTASLAQGDRSGEQVARTVVTGFMAIDEALAPIIGPRGVDALLRRCVHVVGRSYPWLSDAGREAAAGALDRHALEAALGRQPGAAAAAVGATLFLTYRELLASLVGKPLGERLLRSMWIQFFSESPAQDNAA